MIITYFTPMGRGDYTWKLRPSMEFHCWGNTKFRCYFHPSLLSLLHLPLFFTVKTVSLLHLILSLLILMLLARKVWHTHLGQCYFWQDLTDIFLTKSMLGWIGPVLLLRNAWCISSVIIGKCQKHKFTSPRGYTTCPRAIQVHLW